MKQIAIILLALIPVIDSFGQKEKEQHIIDKHLKECLDSTENQTTVGMIECSNRARNAWDKELNNYYKLLMTVLSVEEKESLKNSQRNWITYRDSEIEFTRKMYASIQGTMWRIVSADRQTEITRQRALELRTYYENKASAK